jgi:phage-related minor tail protein
MAEARKQIKIEIIGDSKNAVKAISKLEKTISSTKKSIKKLSNNALSMAKGIASSITDFALSAITDLISGVMDLSKEFRAAENKISGALGVSGAEAKELTGIVQGIWKKGFAGVGQSTDAVIQLKRAFGEMNNEELAQTSEKVLAISRTFNQDLSKSIDATEALVKEFGLSYDQALDMISGGLQDINPAAADDLLDTFGEYSNLMAEAGFSAEEFYSILESGAKTGVLGTDKIADSMKEFSIRMTDGSDATEEALTSLYNAVGKGNPELERLTKEMENADKAVAEAEDNLGYWKDELEKSSDKSDQLSDSLKKAKRELDNLSRPNLAGMEEFDDKLFNLEQDANKVELAMLDMAPDSEEYKNAEKELDAINKQMDKLSLQRDIQLEPQLRAIEKAAETSKQPVVTFGQAMEQIGNKKTEIANLSTELHNAKVQTTEASLQVGYWNNQLETSSAKYENLKTSIKGLSKPSAELLDKISNGSISVRDALPQVLEMLNQIEDPIKRNEIGVALFGTQFEDLGAKAILNLDMTNSSLENFKGKSNEVANSVNNDTNKQKGAWREVQLALVPVAEELNKLITQFIVPLAQQYAPALAAGIKFLTDTFTQQDQTVKKVNNTMTAFKVFFDIILTPLELVKNAINVFISVLVNLKAAADGTITAGKAVKNVATDIKTSFAQAISPIKSLISYLSQLANKLKTIKAPKWLQNAGGKAKGILSKIPGFAEGGTYPANKPFIVGEKGPELMIPDGSSGSVVPNNKLQGVGSNTINAPITININGNADSDVVNAIENRIHQTLDRLVQGKVF